MQEGVVYLVHEMTDGLVLCKLVNKAQPGTQFTCFTSIKVQILTPEE